MRTLLSFVVATAGAVAAVPAAATPPTPVTGTFAVVTREFVYATPLWN